MIIKISRRGGNGSGGGKPMIKYMEYNAIVVIVLAVRRREIGRREYRKCVKYRMLRGVVGMILIIG